MFSLLSLLDDIATTLDDVALMTKVAVKRTSALMADDLAVNSGVVVGVTPDRELPIVKAIFYGSLWNKVYCIVGTLVLMAVYPPILAAIMFVGGIYLSYEGVHKIGEKLLHKKKELKKAIAQIPESAKIKGAIRTDLILSIEIIVIAESTLTGSFPGQVVTLIVVGLAASILIYGLVALIVKVDDLGLYLVEKGFKKTGMLLVNAMPYIMKGLGVVGTIAMLLVGGGIIVHTFHLPLVIPEYVQNFVVGLVAGAIAVGLVKIKNKII